MEMDIIQGGALESRQREALMILANLGRRSICYSSTPTRLDAPLVLSMLRI